MNLCHHPGPCRPRVRHSKTKGRSWTECQEHRAFRARQRRAKIVDGLEDEYGPVPPPVSDYDWFDEVAVDNAIFGGLTRPLTRLEQAEFARRTAREPRIYYVMEAA